MVSGAYQPRLLSIDTPNGRFRSATFVANRQHPRYAPDVPPERAAEMIAGAAGWLGSCADYLYSTVEHLDQLGINDGAMHQLERRVRARQNRLND